MKKNISTYYFIGLALISVMLVFLIPFFKTVMTKVMSEYLEGQAIPPISVLVLRTSCWPKLILSCSIIGLSISLFSRLPDRALLHLVLLSLIAIVLMLAFTLLGYALALFILEPVDMK